MSVGFRWNCPRNKCKFRSILNQDPELILDIPTINSRLAGHPKRCGPLKFVVGPDAVICKGCGLVEGLDTGEYTHPIIGRAIMSDMPLLEAPLI